MIRAVNNGELLAAGEHRTVTRVTAIIELIVANDLAGVRLGDLATALDAPKSTTHGLVKGLIATGYLREEDGRYHTGPAISGLLAAGPVSLPAAYHHALEQLSAQWTETAILATLVGDSAVYLDVVEPATLIRASPPRNKRQPLWPRSSGKCFLAFMEPRRSDAYLRGHILEPAERDRIRAELQIIRETHIAINRGDHRGSDEIGVASPIIRAGATVTTAVALAGPAVRMHDKLNDIADSVRQAAQSLSSRDR
jgi:DNA-binding IclR family transcriptional regulator